MTWLSVDSVAGLAGSLVVFFSFDCFSIRLKICRGCRTLYYCSEECQSLHWTAGHKKECKVLGKIHQDVKEESRGGAGASDQVAGAKMEPLQGSQVVEDLVAKLKRKQVFFEDNLYLYDEDGTRNKDSDFMINKFKFYTAFFSDEEVSNLEDSKSFEEMETYFNQLVTKYSKVVGEIPEGWDGWEQSSREKDSKKEDAEEEEVEGRGYKSKKNKKGENKRKLRRKLL